MRLWLHKGGSVRGDANDARFSFDHFLHPGITRFLRHLRIT
jgi:hypothetical protein